MITADTKGEAVREKFFKAISLSKANRELAERYLDMDLPEDEGLLSQAEHQSLELTMPRYLWEDGDYPGWLRKRKRTEELGRCMRFLAAVGGSTAGALLNDFKPPARLLELEESLVFLTGAHAEEQKTAIRAGMCVQFLHRRKPEEVKAFCQSGAEDPDLFLRAAAYCYDLTRFGKVSNTRMLLLALYLHHKEPGTAPEIVQELEASLIASFLDLSAFEKRELVTLETYARNAEKDTPFPHRILSIYQERRSGIESGFLSGCAFLAVKHSLRFEIILRMMAAVNTVERAPLGRNLRRRGRNLMLETCMGIAEEAWFDARMEEMEDMLPIPDEGYVLYCLDLGYRKAVERMAVKCPEGVKKAAEEADSGLYRELMEIIRDTGLCRELQVNYKAVWHEKLASEIVSRVCPGKEDAKNYMLGVCSAEALSPHMKEWGNDLYEEKENHQRFLSLKRLEPSMYRRGLVLQALRKMAGYFAHYPVYEEEAFSGRPEDLLCDPRQIGGILDLFAEEHIPVFYQTEAVSGMGESLNKKKKALYLERCAKALSERAAAQNPERWEEGMKRAVQEGSAPACCLGLAILARQGDRYRDLFLSCAGNSAKQVRTKLFEICREYPEWKPQVLTLLTSKKVKEREFAVLLLEEWGDSSCLEAVQEAYGREKNKKLAASLAALAEALEQEAKGANGSGRAKRAEERLAAEIFRGGRKKKVEWVQSLTLPEVHRRDGEKASSEYLLSILAACADQEPAGISEDANRLAAPLKPEELSGYMRSLYEGWLSAGAEAKKRWVLYGVSVYGGQSMIQVFLTQIRDWAEHQRGAMAAEAVRALALNGSPEALRLVDQMSRKYKFRQVKNAAGEALKQAAAALGISREELEDRLVPDLGFDEKAARVFDYGSRSFTVRLGPALELEVCDSSGKRLKNLPAPGRQDDPEKAVPANQAFKKMKKQLKEVAGSQKLRLEQALSTQRFWEPDKWKALFVNHPVMQLFAMSLIWGVYEGTEPGGTFRYMEDGSFNTADEEAYPFPESGKIGLVHPLELPEEVLAAWKEQFSDYEITQPFEQLDRPVFRVTEEEREEMSLTRFEGRTLNGLSLSGRLLKTGWFRGEILDAGFFENFYRRDGSFGAELTFSGCPVNYENEEVTIHRLYFYRLPEGPSGNGAFRKEDRCLLREVEPRYFSEVMLQVGKAVGVRV